MKHKILTEIFTTLHQCVKQKKETRRKKILKYTANFFAYGNVFSCRHTYDYDRRVPKVDPDIAGFRTELK